VRPRAFPHNGCTRTQRLPSEDGGAHTTHSDGGDGTLPFAKTVDGQSLASAAPIEAAVGVEDIARLDTGGALVATITGS